AGDGAVLRPRRRTGLGAVRNGGRRLGAEAERVGDEGRHGRDGRVPGVDPKELEIVLTGDLLTLKGEKEKETVEKEERYHRVERTYGAFLRSVRLPVAVDGSRVTATLKNGVLVATLPKTPASKGTMIPVKAE